MIPIAMAPVTEPGMLTLQAREGAWQALLVQVDATGQKQLAAALRDALVAAGAEPVAKGRVLLHDALLAQGEGPVLRLRLVNNDARQLLQAAGVSH